MSDELFAFRPMSKADEAFIYNSWLKSYRDSPTVRSVPNSLYFAAHHDVIEQLLSSPTANVIIACNPEDPEQIYGYGVGDVGVIHWIYVKHPFRGNGLGRALEQRLVGTADAVTYTHRVKTTDRLIRDKNYTYNPYVLLTRASA